MELDDLEEHFQDFRVEVVKQLTSIDGRLEALTEAIEHWATHTKAQNGRIKKLEDWMIQRKLDLEHMAGVLQGRNELKRRDVAVIMGVVAGVSTLLTMAVQLGLVDLIKTL